MLIVDTVGCVLWEVYSAYDGGTGWTTDGCIARWDLTSNALRPDGWTSGDAAGLPLTPLLIREDEASNGPINHGFRFTLESGNIQGPHTVWQWPARHNTGDGSTSTPMMVQVFRLKSSFPIPTQWSNHSKAIATAFMQYGIYVADIGSNGYVQGEPNANWDQNIFCEVGAITLGDFEAVDMAYAQGLSGWNKDSLFLPPIPANANGFGTVLMPSVSALVVACAFVIF